MVVSNPQACLDWWGLRFQLDELEDNLKNPPYLPPGASITLLCRIIEFRGKVCSAARTAPDQTYQPRLDRVQHLFPRNTRSFF